MALDVHTSRCHSSLLHMSVVTKLIAEPRPGCYLWMPPSPQQTMLHVDVCCVGCALSAHMLAPKQPAAAWLCAMCRDFALRVGGMGCLCADASLGMSSPRSNAAKLCLWLHVADSSINRLDGGYQQCAFFCVDSCDALGLCSTLCILCLWLAAPAHMVVPGHCILDIDDDDDAVWVASLSW